MTDHVCTDRLLKILDMPLKGWRLTTLAEPVQMSTDFTNRQKNNKPAPNRNGLIKDPRYVIKTSRIYQS